MSTLDLRSGYWQCGLSEIDKEKTSFCIPGSGLWQFKVLPFGLKGAPATFERLMEKVLAGLTWKVCLVYLDDIVVFSKTFDEHLNNLSEVCKRMRGANLKLHPSKCILLQNEVTFLGHKVSKDGIRTDEEKIISVRDWPTPRNVKDVRSFVGLCSYYRRFVQNFSIIAKPLHQLTEKGRKFEWTPDCEHAFVTLKQCLITTPVLGFPMDEGTYTLDTDASDFGMSGVLSQTQNGMERVISYFSKTFTKCERNYCVTRRELLAIVCSIKHFHRYLYGRKFLVRSDHGSLRWLINFKNPEGQLARWLEVLSAYDFTIEHRAGRIHSNADALSRRPCPEGCSYCSRKEETDNLRVSVAGVELNSTSSTKDEVVSVKPDLLDTLTRPVKDICRESCRAEKVERERELGGGFKIQGDDTCTKVQNETLSAERCMYGTCFSDGANLKVKCIRSTKEIDTGVANSLVSVYKNKCDSEKFAGETSIDVCKPKTSNKSGDFFHENKIRAVQTRSMKKRETSNNKTPSSVPEDVRSSLKSCSQDVENEQKRDNTLKLVRAWVENNQKPNWADVAMHNIEIKYYWNRIESFEIKDNILCRKWESNNGKKIAWQIVMPENLKSSVLKQLHDSVTGGHLGLKKTLSKVRQRYFWFGIRKYVENWCRKCDVCASRKSPPTRARAPMRKYNVGAPLERIAIDVMGPLPTSLTGNKYLLVICDYFTKFAHAVPMRNQEADTVAKTLVDNFITIFGVPMQIHTDQGSNFESNLFKGLCKLLDIDKTRTTVMRPQSDGMAERCMRTLEDMLSSFVSIHQKDWDTFISVLMMAYRSSIHESIGVSPCRMMYGREINLPVDLLFGKPSVETGTNKNVSEYISDIENVILSIHEFARDRLSFSSDVMKRLYDHKIHHKLYNPGDPVWYYQYQRKVGRNPKFQRPWHGPFVVVDRLNDVLYRIKLNPKSPPKVVHYNKLKPYVGDNAPSWFGSK